MYQSTEEQIQYMEDAKRDMSNMMRTYVTAHNIYDLSPDRMFVAFMNAVDDLLFLDSDDIADRCEYHYEWTAEVCWKRLHHVYKEQIIAAVPDIREYMEWRTAPHDTTPFHIFKLNVFNRVVSSEKAEIIKRAQTKMLKEEIAMKVMHPDRIERMSAQYGEDVLDYY
jgi:hypothetical protein